MCGLDMRVASKEVSTSKESDFLALCFRFAFIVTAFNPKISLEYNSKFISFLCFFHNLNFYFLPNFKTIYCK